MSEWKEFREELLQDPEVKQAYEARAVERELARAVLQQRIAQKVTQKEMAEKMDKKGIIMNMAFAVSGSFVFGDHLAFTMAFDGAYVLPVIAGKLVSGILAVVLAGIIFDKVNGI